MAVESNHRLESPGRVATGGQPTPGITISLRGRIEGCA
jgi:hypothetical protein